MTNSNKHHSPLLNILLGALLLFSSGIAYALPPTFSKVFSPSTIGPGSISTATFTINNSSEAIAVTGLIFTDTLPTGVTVASPAMLTSDCGTPTLSATEMTDTISMSDGAVGAFSSCTLSVNVTSSSAGAHTNPVITLNSSAGDSSSLATDLTVVNTLPGFSKSFSPAAVKVGARSTLTFTIDNTLNGSLASRLTFTDNLPVGMVVASPANVSNTCPLGDVSAVPESSVVSLTPGAVLANTICTITVDVIATGIGALSNLSGELQTDTGSAGMAGATLTASADELIFTKSFTDDPVTPGGTATLRFDIRNTNRSNAATAIAFSDDLNAMLAGTTVASVLSDTCSGTPGGTGTFSYSGGIVAADGGACAIEISLSISGAAAEGTYPSTSSTISASSGTFSAASDTLFLFAAPVISKSFINDLAVAGGTVTLEYTITNPSATDAMTDISFIDEFPSILPTASAGPTAISCGVAPLLDFTPLINPPADSTRPARLTLSGATLAAGASCTISITLDVLQTAPGGLYSSITDPITATMNGTTRTGNQASDNLLVVSAPSFGKHFTNATVVPGGSVTLDFTLGVSASAPGDVSNITFSDNVNTMLAGTTVNSVVVDTCGGTSTGVGSGLFDYSGSTLSPGTSCTVSILLDIDAAATTGSYTNTSSTITALADDGTTATHAVSGPEAIDDLLVTGVEFTKEFINDTVLPGGTTTLRYTFDNSAALPGQDVTLLVSFADDLGKALSGLAATGLPLPVCGGTVAGTTSLTFSNVTVAAGASCSVDVTLNVPANASDGSYTSTTNSWFASIGGSPLITLPPATDTLTVQSEYITLSKSFTDDPLTVGGTGTLQFVLGVDATSPGTVDNISFTDDLAATLSGLIFTSVSTSTDCTGFTLAPGSMITVSGVSLAPGASCNIFLDLELPGGASPGVYLNSTSALSGDIGGSPVTGSAASDTLTIRAASLTKSFSSAGVSGGIVNLSFTLDNEDFASGISNLAFNDDLNAAISGLVSITPPQADVCGTGSLFSGSSLLTLTNGDLGAGASCTITVTLQIPVTTAGAYFNTSGQLFSNGLAVNGSASATLTVLNTVPVNTVVPVISGTASVGSQLSSNNGSWTDANGDTLTYSYQWKADGVNIGTNSNLYTLTAVEADKAITVTVIANDANGGSVSATAGAVFVGNRAPVNTVVPVITGTTAVGVTVNVDNGTWTDADNDALTYTYQWKADGADITGATSNAYNITGAELGAVLTAVVTANDGNGSSVSVTSQGTPVIGATADTPVVTAPADITVNATGLFTAVETGIGTAVDAVDGISLASANLPSHFSPGIHLITWSSTDSDGNTGTDVQTVNVIPMISLSQDQMTVEGDTVSFSVILNGDAVAYPVTVAYSISGSAATDGSDHTLVNDTATINSGTEASISFDIIDDGAGEGVENVIVTLINPDNAVLGNSSMSIDFIETNLAPVASLSATQGAGNTFNVTNAGGIVTVSGSIVDVNAADSHSYDWSASDNALIDTDGATETFSFDPLNLSPGFYTVRLSINDGQLTDSVEMTLEVLASATVLSNATDSDDDGIDDQSEGDGDSDGDGLADYLDAIAALNVLPSLGASNQRFLLEANPGLTLGLGKAALESGNSQTLIQLTEVESTDLYDVSIAGVKSIGGSIDLVIPQQQAIPAGAFYGILIDGIWQDFAVDANNQISSAAGDAGYCPPPGDAAYQAGLNEGDYCVQLGIENGGPNDSNASTNKVDSTGGVAEDTGSESGSGSMHPLWMLFALYGLVRLQRQKH